MTEQMSFGIELMLAGMGIVFLFLTLLVVVINVMSKIIRHFAPQPHAQTFSGQADAQPQYLIAAITAAVHRYRKR